MKKKLSAILAVILCFTATISHASAYQADIVNMCAYEDPGKISPFEINSDLQYEAVRFVFDSLYYISEEEKASPMLGTDLTINQDFSEYKITLKDGVTWHDGKSVTPEDVVYTFNAAKEIPWFKNRLKSLDSAYSEGNVITFKLKYSNAVFMEEGISYVPIVPKAIYEAGRHESIGSGPYKLTKNDGKQYIFEASDYHFGVPTSKKIVVDVLASSSECAQKIISREYATSFGGLKVDDYYSINKMNHKDVSVYGLKPKVLFINTKAYPLDNQMLRKAMSAAIDFDKLVNDIYKGEADKGKPGFVSGRLGYAHGDINYAMDIEGTRSLLTSVGYTYDSEGALTDSVNSKVSVTLKAKPGMDFTIAQLIKENLAAIGVDVQISEDDSLMSAINDKSYQMAILDLDSYYGSCETGFMTLLDSNYANYSNYSSDRLTLAKTNYASYAASAQDRYKYLIELQEIMNEEMPFITLAYQRELSSYNEGLYDAFAYKKGVGVYSYLSFIPNRKSLAKEINTGLNKDEPQNNNMRSIIFVGATIVISFGVLLMVMKIKKKNN